MFSPLNVLRELEPAKGMTGLKKICDQNWQTLGLEDKLILMELVLVMMSSLEQWGYFVTNVIIEPVGYVDG